MSSSPVTIDGLLRQLVERQGSDLHLKPMRPPLIRLKGKLVPLESEPLAPDTLSQLLDAVIPERLRAQLDRRMAAEFGYGLPGLSRFRASVFQQRGTRAAVFRRVPFDFPSLEDWGLPPVLTDFCALPQGLVLITGPTGSGKSSTLAALMRRIARTRRVHIVTIEDPIEFLLKDDLAAITQREVGTDTPSFPLALRNTLRQDPDVVMVGEMRDADTIRTVLTAAETGHLVFSTLHTNGSVQTIDRILDGFPERGHRQVRQQLAGVLEAVVSLRLVPRMDDTGLIAAAEILRRTPRVSRLILSGELDALHEEMENSVSYHRMQSMNQSLAALVLNGVVSRQSALEATAGAGDLDLILRKFAAPTAAGPQGEGEGDPMSEPMSDFSKILELQEIRKLYDEQQERHRQELAERDRELARLRAGQSESVRDVRPEQDAELVRLREENDRLNKQVQASRTDYEAKLERLNARLRAATTRAPEETAEPERRGFFRR